MKKRYNTPIFRIVRALAFNTAFAFGFMGSVLPADPINPPQAVREEPLRMSQTAPPEGDGAGIVVRLELPWKVLLWGEAVSYNYILENRSQVAIPIAVPYTRYGLGMPSGGQAFIEGIHVPAPRSIESPYYSETRLLRVEEADWPPLTLENRPVEFWAELPSAHKLVWNHARLNPINFPIGIGDNLRVIRAHWLIGKGKWVSSPDVQVRVEKVDRKLWHQVFSQSYDEFGVAGANRTEVVFRIPLDGKFFLFTQVLSRICEVREDDNLQFKIDPENDQMEVTVTGLAGNKKHYYAMGQGLVRETPWKAQGYAALIPVPEPIPEADLISKGEIIITDLSKPPVVEPPTAMVVPSLSNRHWPWWAAAAAVLVLSIVAVFFLHRKGKN
jgi:hypothetical protein